MSENWWAKSLYHPVRDDNKNKEPCGWSNEFGMIIHRFNLNTTVCRCGSKQYKKREYSGGWKRQKIDSEQ